MKRPSRQGGAQTPFLVAFVLGFLISAVSWAEPLVSPTWGFSVDLPAGYVLVEGDGERRFSFASEEGDRVDLIVYPEGRFSTADSVAEYAVTNLKAESESSDFRYRGNRAILLSLAFETDGRPVDGWGLCLQLAPRPSPPGSDPGGTPFLLALAYGRAGDERLDEFHRSALDSIAPTAADRDSVGPLSAFAYPPTVRKTVRVALLDAEATIDETDAEAARSLVDREFSVLTQYANAPLWKDAWTRFYRLIFRDSYDRLADVAFAVERALTRAAPRKPGADADSDRALAESALRWVQGFAYERNLMGSDFVDLVSAATEGRGDCDSRSLLLAVVLMRADIASAIMVSRDYSHAMALVDAPGTGARFDCGGGKWLVAETTAKVPLGLIGKDKADPNKWLGIKLK